MLCLCSLLFSVEAIQAQITNTAIIDTASGVKIKQITIGGYLDTYYAFDFNKPKNKIIPYFVSSNKHNEFAVNLGYLDLRYSTQRTRARIVTGFGSYMESNYVNEKGFFKNIVEASASVCLSKKKNIWLDAGVFGSPFTNESAISKDHFLYTRSLAPEYVPYYLAGVKLAIPFNDKWNVYLYLLNGWQQIEDQNNAKSFATQVEYRPTLKHLINWNTYVGDERSFSQPNLRMRYFTDIYWLYKVSSKFNFISCVYGGLQEYLNNQPTNSKVNYWWQANASGKWNLNEHHSLSFRLEYFNDPTNAMMVNVIPNKPIHMSSVGGCYNYQLSENALFRLDGRLLHGKKEIYENAKHNAAIITGNLTVWF